MGLLNHNNKLVSIDWGFDTKGFEFAKCAELKKGKKYQIHGVFITPDNGYGEGAVAILDDKLLNLPQRYTQDVKDIMADTDAVEDIKSGNFGIVITTFESKKFKRTGYDIEFVEM